MATKSRSQFTADNADNRLSLFPETTDAELADNLGEEPFDDRNGYPDTPWKSDPGALETPSAQDGREPGARESPPANDLRSPGANGQPPVQADSGAENGIPPGLGNRDEEMGVSPGRGGSAPIVVRSGDPRSKPTLYPRSPHKPYSRD